MQTTFNKKVAEQYGVTELGTCSYNKVGQEYLSVGGMDMILMPAMMRNLLPRRINESTTQSYNINHLCLLLPKADEEQLEKVLKGR